MPGCRDRKCRTVPRCPWTCPETAGGARKRRPGEGFTAKRGRQTKDEYAPTASLAQREESPLDTSLDGSVLRRETLSWTSAGRPSERRQVPPRARLRTDRGRGWVVDGSRSDVYCHDPDTSHAINDSTGNKAAVTTFSCSACTTSATTKTSSPPRMWEG